MDRVTEIKAKGWTEHAHVGPGWIWGYGPGRREGPQGPIDGFDVVFLECPDPELVGKVFFVPMLLVRDLSLAKATYDAAGGFEVGPNGELILRSVSPGG